jgi:type II secretory pathway pseudopilin PulG
MRWIFVIAGVVFAVIAIMMATEIPRLMDFKDKFRELDQKINTADLGDKILKSQPL